MSSMFYQVMSFMSYVAMSYMSYTAMSSITYLAMSSRTYLAMSSITYLAMSSSSLLVKLPSLCWPVLLPLPWKSGRLMELLTDRKTRSEDKSGVIPAAVASSQ